VRRPPAQRQAVEIKRMKAQGVTPSEIAVRMGTAVPASTECWPNSKMENMRLPDPQIGRATPSMHIQTINRPNDGLLGFTGFTVTARYGSVIYTYDDKGMTIYSKVA
jgi:hypothetical protein